MTTGKSVTRIGEMRVEGIHTQSYYNSRDVSHVKVEIVDSEGRMVPIANNLVEFEITGTGRIIGVDNGNPVDHDPHKADYRRAYHGLALAIVQATREAGTISLTAVCEGLEGDSVEVSVVEDVNPSFYLEDLFGID